MLRKLFSVPIPQAGDEGNTAGDDKILSHQACNYPILRESGDSSSQFEILRYPSGKASGLLALGGQVEKWDHRQNDGIMVIACSSSARQKPVVNIMRVEDHECQFITQYPMIGEPKITSLSLHPSEYKFAITRLLSLTKIYGFKPDGSRFDAMMEFRIHGTSASCLHGPQDLFLGTVKGNVFKWDTRIMSSDPSWCARVPGDPTTSRRHAIIAEMKVSKLNENEIFAMWKDSSCHLGAWDLRMNGDKGPVKRFHGIDSTQAFRTGPVHFDVSQAGNGRLVAACISSSSVGLWGDGNGGEPLDTISFEGEITRRARFVGPGTEIDDGESRPGLWVETDRKLHSLEFKE